MTGTRCHRQPQPSYQIANPTFIVIMRDRALIAEISKVWRVCYNGILPLGILKGVVVCKREGLNMRIADAYKIMGKLDFLLYPLVLFAINPKNIGLG